MHRLGRVLHVYVRGGLHAYIREAAALHMPVGSACMHQGAACMHKLGRGCMHMSRRVRHAYARWGAACIC